MSPQVREELFGLLSSLCDDALTAEQRDRLERLLDDVECRRAYLTYLNVHARLLTHPRWSAELVLPAELGPALPPSPLGDLPSGNHPSNSRQRLVLAVRYALVVAATLLVATVGQLVWSALRPSPAPGPGLEDRQPAGPADYVASLTHGANCEWELPPERTTPGARLLPGELLLRRGVALVRFDGGAELLLEGPLGLQIESATSATLRSGKVVFKTDLAAAPFVLKTPDSVLQDQGTEYAVRVGPNGEEVHVFEGEVLRTARTDSQIRELLPAGEARRFQSGSSPGSPIQVAPRDFIRLPPPAGDPPGEDRDGLLAYEGFDYPSPQLLAGGGSNGGVGWDGPWVVAVKKDPVRLSARGLDFPNARLRPTGGCIESAGHTYVYRKLATPLRMDQDAIYYLSYLFRHNHSSGVGPDNNIHLSFRDSRHPEVEKRLRIGLGPKKPVVYVQYEGGSVGVPLPLSPERTYLLVAKVVAGKERPDQVLLRVYGPEEPVDPEEPKYWSVVTRSFHSDEVFDRAAVLLRARLPQSLDEIRIGKSWRSVTAWAVSRPGAGN
jgi:hypothetical protein